MSDKINAHLVLNVCVGIFLYLADQGIKSDCGKQNPY